MSLPSASCLPHSRAGSRELRTEHSVINFCFSMATAKLQRRGVRDGQHPEEAHRRGPLEDQAQQGRKVERSALNAQCSIILNGPPDLSFTASPQTVAQLCHISNRFTSLPHAHSRNDTYVFVANFSSSHEKSPNETAGSGARGDEPLETGILSFGDAQFELLQ